MESRRGRKRFGYQRMSDLSVSLTDPDALLMRQHNHGVHLRYRDHYLVDGGKARIIVGVLVTAADVIENMPFLDDEATLRFTLCEAECHCMVPPPKSSRRLVLAPAIHTPM
jgi:hypothetical protein